MKRLAPAFLILALALALPASAQEDPPSGTATDPAPAATEAPKADAPQREYRDMNGQVISDPEALRTIAERRNKVLGPDGNLTAVPENLPEYARKAMDSGLTPIMAPDGSILGFDDPSGRMSWLATAVQERFGGTEPQAGTTTGDQSSVTGEGAVAKNAAEQGRTPKPGDRDFIGPLPSGFCEGNPSAEVCGDKDEPKQDPGDSEISKSDIDGDVGDLSRKMDERNRERDRQESGDPTASDSGPQTAGRGGDNPFGGPGAGNASTDRPGTSITGGGTTLGPNAQVASGPGQGKEIRCRGSECDRVARNLKDFHANAGNVLDGPRDPNVRSVYQTASNLAFLDPLKRLAARLWEGDAAGAGTLAPGVVLDDQAAASGSREFDGSGEYVAPHRDPKVCKGGPDFCWNAASPD